LAISAEQLRLEIQNDTNTAIFVTVFNFDCLSQPIGQS
jgi:hypothetical protein